MRDKEKSRNATGNALALEKSLQEVEKYIAETSRANAERFLAQLEDALARLCDNNNVAKAAVQLIAERSTSILPYTPVVRVGKEAKREKELLAEMTLEERQKLEALREGIEENARRDYEKATVIVREFYGSLTQLLTRIAHEPDNGLGVGAWRILESGHPNLRFYVAKPRQRHAR